MPPPIGTVKNYGKRQISRFYGVNKNQEKFGISGSSKKSLYEKVFCFLFFRSTKSDTHVGKTTEICTEYRTLLFQRKTISNPKHCLNVVFILRSRPNFLRNEKICPETLAADEPQALFHTDS